MANNPTESAAIPKRILGSSDLEVSVVGCGAGSLSKCADEGEARDVVHTFLKAGCTFVDTSPSYGSGISERRVGVALAGIDRSGYVLQTKCGDEGPHNGGHSPFSRRGVLASVEHSLSELGCGHLDSLLLHDPYRDELEVFLGDGGGMEAIRELRSAGVVRAFGMGCREHEPHLQLLKAIGPDEFDIAVTVDDHNLMRRYLDKLGLREELRGANVGIINGAPLYRGLLTAQPIIYGSSSLKPAPALLQLSAAFRQFAQAHGRSLLDLTVNFPVRLEDIAMSIYGCTTVAQAEEVIASARQQIPATVWDEFDDEFDDRVAAVSEGDHFYWFKNQKPGNVEWSEMSSYPRANFAESLLPENR